MKWIFIDPKSWHITQVQNFSAATLHIKIKTQQKKGKVQWAEAFFIW
jgi:hypothetical protein